MHERGGENSINMHSRGCLDTNIGKVCSYHHILYYSYLALNLLKTFFRSERVGILVTWKVLKLKIDDKIVHADTEMKHDCLNSVLDRCTKINLTLNKEKCVFKVKKVTLITNLYKRGSSPIVKKLAPLKTCRHQLTRAELNDC